MHPFIMGFFTFIMLCFIYKCSGMFSGHLILIQGQLQQEVVRTSEGGSTYDVFFITS